MPAVGSPKLEMPGENLFLNCAQHDEDEANGRKLCQNPKDDTETAANLGYAQKDGEAFAHLDALASACGILEMVDATGDEDQGHHEAEQKKGEVCITEKLRKEHNDSPSQQRL